MTLRFLVVTLYIMDVLIELDKARQSQPNAMSSVVKQPVHSFSPPSVSRMHSHTMLCVGHPRFSSDQYTITVVMYINRKEVNVAKYTMHRVYTEAYLFHQT